MKTSFVSIYANASVLSQAIYNLYHTPEYTMYLARRVARSVREIDSHRIISKIKSANVHALVNVIEDNQCANLPMEVRLIPMVAKLSRNVIDKFFILEMRHSYPNLACHYK